MKKLVILTGAGMSAESGISTFRDAGGLWDRYPVEQVATPEGWERNPALVTEFYNRQRMQLAKALPNEGHRLLARLEEAFDVAIVTQNVDDLHERAGSSHVVHLHGELMKVCSSRRPDDARYIRTLGPDELRVEPGTLAPDGSLLRPWIVWFGEAVPNMTVATHLAAAADVFVIIGTSLNVYPAAGLIHYVPREAPVFLIDPKPVAVPEGWPVHIISDVATAGVRTLTRELQAIG